MNREEVEHANVAQLAMLFQKHGELKQEQNIEVEAQESTETQIPQLTIKQTAAAAAA